MATRAAAVQTPGEVPMTATEVKHRHEEAMAAANAAAAPTMEKLQAQIAAMGAMMQQLQANQRAIPSEAKANADNLPDMASLDLDAINKGSTPVLTRQGWIVPANFGADPVSLAEKAAQEKRDATLMKLAEVAAGKA